MGAVQDFNGRSFKLLSRRPCLNGVLLSLYRHVKITLIASVAEAPIYWYA